MNHELVSKTIHAIGYLNKFYDLQLKRHKEVIRDYYSLDFHSNLSDYAII
jgi:hypothetical protein